MTVYKKKNGKWYCKFQIKGVEKHLLCAGAKTAGEAQAIEDAEKFKLRQQQVGLLPQEAKSITIQRLADVFLDYSALNKKSHKQDVYRVKAILQYFKPLRQIHTIKPVDIERFKKSILDKGVSKTTVNRYLEPLSKMFNMAIDNEWLIKNPIRKGSKFVEKNYTIRYLTELEESRLFENLSTELEPIVVVALNTGLRKGNILTLKWRDLNFEFKTIEVLDNKGNKHIKLFMNDVLNKLFLNIQKKDNEYIFINPETKRPYKETAFNKKWNKVKEAANIIDFRFHDLRHTVGTRLAQANVPLSVIKDNILFHSDIRTTMRYVHNSSVDVQNAMTVLNSYNKDFIQNDKSAQSRHDQNQKALKTKRNQGF